MNWLTNTLDKAVYLLQQREGVHCAGKKRRDFLAVFRPSLHH